VRNPKPTTLLQIFESVLIMSPLLFVDQSQSFHTVRDWTRNVILFDYCVHLVLLCWAALARHCPSLVVDQGQSWRGLTVSKYFCHVIVLLSSMNGIWHKQTLPDTFSNYIHLVWVLEKASVFMLPSKFYSLQLFPRVSCKFVFRHVFGRSSSKVNVKLGV
jgi:hypothetical protein